MPQTCNSSTDELRSSESVATRGKSANLWFFDAVGKNDPELEDIPPPPPVPEPSAWDTLDLGASATADGNVEDDWGGFTSAKAAKK